MLCNFSWKDTWECLVKTYGMNDRPKEISLKSNLVRSVSLLSFFFFFLKAHM